MKKILLILSVLFVTACARQQSAPPVGAAPQRENYTVDTVPVVMPELSWVREWKKPTTDAAWNEDVKIESLDVKHNTQLEQMRQNLLEKLPKVEAEIEKFSAYPDAVRYQLKDQGFSGNQLEQEYIEQMNHYVWKKEKILQSLERIAHEQDLRTRKVVDRKPIGTTFYIDYSAAGDLAGTSTGAPYNSIDDFAEAVRSAGDIAWVRRGQASTTNITDVVPTSDGGFTLPIVLAADYDNLWGDFATTTETWTVDFGSRYMQSSASSTSVFPSKWIYVYGDQWEDPNNPTTTGKLFAYEVNEATSTGLALFLPYKGNQSGSGKSLRAMPAAPIWNVVTGAFEWNWDLTNNWFFQGLEVRGNDANGNIEIDSGWTHYFSDMILRSNDTAGGLRFLDETFRAIVRKSRFIDHSAVGNINFANDSFGRLEIYDSDLGNSMTSVDAIAGGTATMVDLKIFDSDFDDTAASHINLSGNVQAFNLAIRNTAFFNDDVVGTIVDSQQTETTYFEDWDNTPNDNRQRTLTGIGAARPWPHQKSTAVTRSGGGASSILITPSTSIAPVWEHTRLKLFDYPIYADTTSKVYTVYFNSTSTVHWTADPTNNELWIECEFWGHARNNHRKTTKSTGTVDFNGAITWQSLTVTCQPSQTGILYLRGWYGKYKETGTDDTNTFYVDVQPDIQ